MTRKTAGRNRWWTLGGLFLALGIAVGLVIAAGMDCLPVGKAGTSSGRTAPEPVSLPQVAPKLAETQQAFVEIAKAVTPSVVNISTTRVVRSPRPAPFFGDPFFRDFFGEDFSRRFQTPKRRRLRSLGSGVIVSPEGYILTNNHVVEQADAITVRLSDRREFKAKIIGADPKTDIAVVKIDAKGLPAIPLGDSDGLQVGEFVLAIGNPFGLNQTVTMGIISAVGRANVGIADYEDFIQTDAAINPGNSGGPLVNTRGEVAGINTAIFSRSGGYQGIGFAVPSNMAKAVMESLIKIGKVIRGWLGVLIQEVSDDLAQEFGVEARRGALVGDVTQDSPAEKAGLRVGDVVVRYDGKTVQDVAHLRNLVAQTAPGTQVVLEILRKKQEKKVTVTIGTMPKEMAEARTVPGGEGTAGGVLDGLVVRTLTPDIARQLDLPGDEKGIVVVRVDPGSPTGEAGLRRRDVIQEINHQKVRNVEQYRRLVSKLKPDQRVILLVKRGGHTRFLTIKPQQ